MEDQKPPKDRGEGGHFAPGNKLGRGNPFAGKVQAYRREIFEAFKTGHVVAVMQSMWQMAVGIDPTDPNPDINLRRRMRPDYSAAQVFLRYTVGEPAKVDHEAAVNVHLQINTAVEQARLELQSAICPTLMSAEDLGRLELVRQRSIEAKNAVDVTSEPSDNDSHDGSSGDSQ